jgi:hypothetical protein
MEAQLARMLRSAREISKSTTLSPDEALMRCPVCESNGVAVGDFEVEYGPTTDWDEAGKVTHVEASVWFIAIGFYCRVCRLRLDKQAELTEAKVSERWKVEGADPREYEAPWDYDEDAAYDTWREERA